ncbi:hypothetical protein C2845_PM06G09090 [Panicum miliaceum]|uniref:Uncharacterized protein n=1 Tax=Panicum miliaceum TaxID=4540 RepID=A0A3L6RAR5_PANMI|nr:hypothetical protein C2845_PM06G09090 [Panicum miliaceum]
MAPTPTQTSGNSRRYWRSRKSNRASPPAITTGKEVRPQLPPVAARCGAETVKPALRRIYMTRASTCTAAMKSFVGDVQDRRGSRISCRRRLVMGVAVVASSAMRQRSHRRRRRQSS